MDSSQTPTELIDRYLKNALDSADRQAFEERCKTDEAFAEEVRKQVKAEYTVRMAAKEARASELNALFDSLPKPEEAGRVIAFPRWGAVAIAVAAALLLLFLIWPGQNQPTARELYAAYQTPSQQLAYRSEGEAPTPFSQAMELFAAQSYRQAAEKLEVALQDSAFDRISTANYYLGLSYSLTEDQKRAAMETNFDLLSKAVSAFKKVNQESSFYERSLWQIALVELKSGDKAAAIEALEAVVAYPGHFKAGDAREILGKLGETKLL